LLGKRWVATGGVLLRTNVNGVTNSGPVLHMERTRVRWLIANGAFFTNYIYPLTGCCLYLVDLVLVARLEYLSDLLLPWFCHGELNFQNRTSISTISDPSEKLLHVQFAAVLSTGFLPGKFGDHSGVRRNSIADMTHHRCECSKATDRRKDGQDIQHWIFVTPWGPRTQTSA
jgi:hypothetical protein